MKHSFKVLAVCLFAVVLAVSPSAGAGIPSTVVKVAIPFDFMVGQKAFQAGDYTVSGYARGMLSIRREDRNPSSIIAMASVQEPKRQGYAKLVFHRYGNSYFLRQVSDGQDYQYDLRESHLERETAKAATTDLARKLNPEVISIIPRK